MSNLIHSPLVYSPEKSVSKRLKVVTAEDLDETPSDEDFPDSCGMMTAKSDGSDSADNVGTAVNPEPVRLGSVPATYSTGSMRNLGEKSIKSSQNSLVSGSQLIFESGNSESGNPDDFVPREIKALLHSLPFFSGLTESDQFIDTISKTLRIRKCKPGDIIVRQGEVAKAMFFIIKGTLKVISEDGEIDLAELSSGSYCKFDVLILVGEIGILFDVKRTATVVAKTAGTLATLTSERVQKELAAYPQIKKSIQDQAKIRLLSLAKEYEKVGRKVSVALAELFRAGRLRAQPWPRGREPVLPDAA